MNGISGCLCTGVTHIGMHVCAGKPAGDSVQQLVGRSLRWVMWDWQISPDPKGGSLTPQYCQGFFDAVTMGKSKSSVTH